MKTPPTVSPVRRWIPAAWRGQKGFALVIALSAVVLLTILILSFFSKAQLNRQISFSGTNQIEADILARSSADLIIGEVREEIRTGGTSSNSGNSSFPLVYEPTSGSNGIMAKSGVTGGDAVGALTIRKVSANGAAINPYTGGRVFGSAASTSAASKNGRKWTSFRWFTGSSSPGLGSASKVPDWVLLSNHGVVVNPSITDARTPSNTSFVIGRFAYTVYDTDGLLDANVAGYASSLGANSGYKTSATYADLTVLVPQIDAFVNWRNQVTGTDAATFQEWATGLKQSAASGTASALALNAAKSGHLSVALGDNAILSRRDLLNDPNVGSAASYLTHFSRQSNGPTSLTVTSGTVSTANPKFDDLRFLTSGTAIHYGDDGTAVSYTVTAGDPLLQRRFSLARLAWVTPSGPSSQLPTSDLNYNAKVIQACFGLIWDDANGRWSYVGASEATVQTTIKPLATVASELREPNFFELLKAGIAEGSLGTYGGNTSSPQTIMQQSKDLQVIKIGANIINCAATDNYPRIIYFAPGGTGVESAGVANLPYLQGVDTIFMSKVDRVNNIMNAGDLIWTPILFNPHATAAVVSGTGPDSIQVALLSGTVLGISVEGCPNAALGAGSSTASGDLNHDLSGQSFSVPSAQFSGFSQRPNGATATSGTCRLGSQINYLSDNSQSNILCFRMFSYIKDKLGTLPTAYEGDVFTARTYFDQIVLALQYKTPGGKMKTYMTLSAYDDGTGKGPAPWRGADISPRTRLTNVIQADCATGIGNSSLNQAVYNNQIDPRSVRFGVSQGWNKASTAATITPLSNYLYRTLPFGWTGSGPWSICAAKWAQGDKVNSRPLIPQPPTLPSYTNMTDLDGVARPADAWLDDAANPANPYGDLADTTRRPVILNRPFRSVAELGYVFRDSPWKTLSFFDDTSADGALLDLFSVADEPAVGRGKMNMNLSSTAVLNAVFKGTGQDSSGSTALSSPDALATAYNGYAMDSSGNPTGSVPLNVSALPTFLMSLNNNTGVGLDHIKYHREAVVRSLAGSAQTRTWNLLIDVVAQTGRYPSSASTLNDFMVDGEKRYWLSVSIDRYTGKVIDRQIEPAWE